MSRGTKVYLWIFGLVQALFLVWIIGAGVDGANQASEYMSQDMQDAAGAGTAMGLAIVAIFWIAVDTMMGLGYIVWRLAKKAVTK